VFSCFSKVHEGVVPKAQNTVRIARSARIGSNQIFATNDADSHKPFLRQSSARGIRFDTDFDEHAATAHSLKLHPNFPGARARQEVKRQNARPQRVIHAAFCKNLADEQQVAHAPSHSRALASGPRFVIQGERPFVWDLSSGAVHLQQ
jgi:hypothetical protein